MCRYAACNFTNNEEIIGEIRLKTLLSLTFSGPQGFYQTDNIHFPKFYYFWSPKQFVVGSVLIRRSFYG